MTAHSGGTRAQVLFALGLIWALTAIGILTSPGTRNLAIPHERLPLWLRFLVWAVPAAVALTAVWWRRIDPTAWGLLWVPPAERCASFLIAWLFMGYGPGWRSVLVYGAIIFLINRCAKGLDRLPIELPKEAT